jgi:dipeptidyl aminopeptidase/acylaminoacyl peptidase
VSVLSRRRREGVRRITNRIFRAIDVSPVDDLSVGIAVVDIKTGVASPVDTGSAVAVQPSFSPCGKWLLCLASKSAVAYQSLGGLSLLVVDLATGQVMQLLDQKWSISAAAWLPCGRIVVAADYDSTMTVPVNAGLWVINSDGSNPRCRTASVPGNLGLRLHHDMPTWETSQNYIFTILNSREAYASITRRGCGEVWRVALDGPEKCELIASGHRSCLLIDANYATSRLLYAVSDLSTPWELAVSDLSGRDERRITHLNDESLARWPKLTWEHLSFESSDGMPIEGWHLRPANASGPSPTVMFIHAGPYIATGHIFRFDFHLLAANGYSVLFANFRGSSGYGTPFARAIMGDWGSRGFPDHMATVDAAVAKGLADPARLGVWGASHGGFATCWVVCHSNRFRAAVAEAASTSFVTGYYLGDSPDWIVRELGGRPDEIPDIYRSRSPLTYAARCHTPTLMLHGEADVRCPMAHAEQFYRALHDGGCPTELVVIPGMTHMGDSTGPLSARVGQNEALLDWFERFL